MGVKLSKQYKFCQIGHAWVAGAAADTDIAVTGIKVGDEIIGCTEFEVTTGVPTDRLSEAVILTDGNIQLTTTSTASDQLEVWWIKK